MNDKLTDNNTWNYSNNEEYSLKEIRNKLYKKNNNLARELLLRTKTTDGSNVCIGQGILPPIKIKSKKHDSERKQSDKEVKKKQKAKSSDMVILIKKKSPSPPSKNTNIAYKKTDKNNPIKINYNINFNIQIQENSLKDFKKKTQKELMSLANFISENNFRKNVNPINNQLQLPESDIKEVKPSIKTNKVAIADSGNIRQKTSNHINNCNFSNNSKVQKSLNFSSNITHTNNSHFDNSASIKEVNNGYSISGSISQKPQPESNLDSNNSNRDITNNINFANNNGNGGFNKYNTSTEEMNIRHLMNKRINENLDNLFNNQSKQLNVEINNVNMNLNNNSDTKNEHSNEILITPINKDRIYDDDSDEDEDNDVNKQIVQELEENEKKLRTSKYHFVTTKDSEIQPIKISSIKQNNNNNNNNYNSAEEEVYEDDVEEIEHEIEKEQRIDNRNNHNANNTGQDTNFKNHNINLNKEIKPLTNRIMEDEFEKSDDEPVEAIKNSNDIKQPNIIKIVNNKQNIKNDFKNANNKVNEDKNEEDDEQYNDEYENEHEDNEKSRTNDNQKVDINDIIQNISNKNLMDLNNNQLNTIKPKSSRLGKTSSKGLFNTILKQPTSTTNTGNIDGFDNTGTSFFPSKDKFSNTSKNFFNQKIGFVSAKNRFKGIKLFQSREDFTQNITDYSDLFSSFNELFNGYHLRPYDPTAYDYVLAMREAHTFFSGLLIKEDTETEFDDDVHNFALESEAENIKDRLRKVSDKLISKNNMITNEQFFLFKQILDLQKKDYGKKKTEEEYFSSKKFFRVVNSRPEIYDILCYTLGLRENWRELPHGQRLGKSWNLLWTYSSPQIDMSKIFVWQRVNHFINNKSIGRKDLLKKSLDRVRKLNKNADKYFDITPPTYILSKEYMAFVDDFTRSAKVEEYNLWIVKPVGKSRGKGIYLIKDISDVPLTESILVQKYLTNPLLIEGYKFDLRIYVVVTSVNPLEAFLYKEGFARMSNTKFSLSNQSLSNNYVHLTNAAIQSKKVDDRTYERIFGGCKISLAVTKEKLAKIGVSWDKIWAQIRQITLKSLSACQHDIPYSPSSFELFGYDIIIDTNQKCILLEVNISPSLERTHVVDDQVKLNLVDDILNLVEPLNFDRRALVSILERRLQMDIKKTINTTYIYSPQVQLNLDLNAIFRGKRPRMYGETPKNLGNFEVLAPTEESEKVIRMSGGQKMFGKTVPKANVNVSTNFKTKSVIKNK